MVEVSLTVGKLDASLALLLTKDHHLIEFPTILLPNGVKAGSIVKISCERDLETETEEQRQFLAVQEEILNTFGKNLPKAPLLKIKNITQTSCVLEWDPLDLGTATLKSLTLFKDGKKLGAIPQPLNNRTTKLSGLSIEKSYKFQLKLDSTAGVYTSETVEVTTHKMTDLSGIQVCLGDITANEQFTVEDIQQTLVNMGAHHPASNKMKVETTHFVTTRENKQNPEFIKANDMNIPIIRPEWLKACEKERRIVGVRDFYVKDCVLPDIFAKNYWSKPAPAVPEISKNEAEASKEEQVASTDSKNVPAFEVSAPSSDSQEIGTPNNTPEENITKKDASISKEEASGKEDKAVAEGKASSEGKAVAEGKASAEGKAPAEDKTEAGNLQDGTDVADEKPKAPATDEDVKEKSAKQAVTEETKGQSKDASSADKPVAERTEDLDVAAQADPKQATANSPVKEAEQKVAEDAKATEDTINEDEAVSEQKEAAVLTEKNTEAKPSTPDFPGEDKKGKVAAASEKKSEKEPAPGAQAKHEQVHSGSLEDVSL